MKKTEFIYWTRQSRRGEWLAKYAFKCPIKKFHYSISNPKILKPVDYLVKFFATLIHLNQTRPEIVICQAGPILAPFAASLYCKLFGAKLIIDCHTRVFTGKMGILLKNITLKKADLIIVHNYHIQSLAKNYLSKVKVLYDNIVYAPNSKESTLSSDFNFVYMSSHIDNNLKTIKILDELSRENNYKITITGDINFKATSQNLTLTGYASIDNYIKVVHSASAIIIVMTRKDSDYVQSGRLIEALSLGKPAIHSTAAVAKEMISKGVVFLDEINKESLKSAMDFVVANYDSMVDDIVHERELFKKKWKAQFEEIISHINRFN
jgi:hypothetical protein